ncbi:MAG: glycosyltransferase family 9 protein [Saprospiraceae bacterium]
MKKILIIQTAFIGDVILATPVVEKLASFYPNAEIDFLLRKGNEGLLANNPYVHEVLVWDKSKIKYLSLFSLAGVVRRRRYDFVVNLHRFASSGIISLFSKARIIVGFDKNPLSIFYTQTVPHRIDSGHHEVQRNLSLIRDQTDDTFIRPKIYPAQKDFHKIHPKGKYICIAPASVWFTKQWPVVRWVGFIDKIDREMAVFLLGGKTDRSFCAQIIKETAHRGAVNLAGELTFLQSAALMKKAEMNYVNDSAPLHLASAVNAPVTALFLSTVPDFGFTPLSDCSVVLETTEKLPCRPCGLHGRDRCPETHFKCAAISTSQLLSTLG